MGNKNTANGALGEMPIIMGSACKKGDDYDSDDSDFGADNLVIDEDIDVDLIANASMPETFLELDEDGTGLIEYPEFLKGFGIDDTPLVQKMFYIFDEDRSGSLDFLEFIKMIDKYRRMTYEERLQWCFQVYDLDGSGYIDKAEFTAILTDMNFQVRNHRSTKCMINKMAKMYFDLTGEPMERVDCAQFCILCRSYGSLIVYPAMGIMERLMGMVLHDPDSHLGALDCLRPGAASMYRAAAQAAEQERQFQAGVS